MMIHPWEDKGDRVKVRGILDEYIILLNCILRDGIFDYLKEKTK